MIFTELIFRITLEQDVTEFHIEYFLARISESLDLSAGIFFNIKFWCSKWAKYFGKK